MKLPTDAAPPYEPAVTAVLSRFKVSVSVAEATDVKPVPPTIVKVSPPAIVKAAPLSAAAVNEVEIDAEESLKVINKTKSLKRGHQE